MKMVCTIRRANGTHPKMPDGTVYDFIPNASGEHIAEVENPAHIALLVSLHSFKCYGDTTEQEASDQAAEQAAMDARTAVLAELNAKTFEELEVEYHHRFGAAARPQTQYEALVRTLAADRIKPGSDPSWP